MYVLWGRNPRRVGVIAFEMNFILVPFPGSTADGRLRYRKMEVLAAGIAYTLRCPRRTTCIPIFLRRRPRDVGCAQGFLRVRLPMGCYSSG
jgi:hypothetical protein